MLEVINTLRMRGLFYGLVFLSSLAVFGNVAELCDIANTCPARLAVVIGIGVFTTIISGLLLIGTLFRTQLLLSLELILSLVLLVAFSVCVGLTSSFRTNLQETIALSFSWVGLALTFIVTFFVMTAERESTPEKKMSKGTKLCCGRGDLEAGEGPPESNYMEAVGDQNVSAASERTGGTNGGEPMVALEDQNDQTS